MKILAENLFMNIMVINFEMLSLGMKNKIGRKSKSRDIVTTEYRNIRKEDLKFFEENAQPRQFSS